VSMINVSAYIKAPFLLGLFLNQIGRSFDALDELVFFKRLKNRFCSGVRKTSKAYT